MPNCQDCKEVGNRISLLILDNSHGAKSIQSLILCDNCKIKLREELIVLGEKYGAF